MSGQWYPSDELQAEFAHLTRRQQNAIVRIVDEEIAGTPLNRLLKTPYSCQWCGWVSQIGTRDERKAALETHEAGCARNGTAWRFVCNFSTYYARWTKNTHYKRALELAQRDMTTQNIDAARRKIQAGAGKAVDRVIDLIDNAEKDDTKLRASFGLLDRAGLDSEAQAAPVSTNNVDYARYQGDPVGFGEEHLGSRYTAGQRAVLEAVRDHPVVVVQSANAVGKTYVGGDLALWFLRAFRRSETYLAAAPPLENLERLLWGELERRLTDHPAAFAEANQGYLSIDLGPGWWVNGVAIPGSGTPAQREAKFSGKHAPHLMFIIDEGDAVPAEVYRGIESCMSGGHARLVVFFNPRESSGPVYQLIKNGAHTVTLDAFSHPNVTTGRVIVPGAVTREKTVQRIHEWTRPATDSDLDDTGKLERDAEWFQVPGHLDGVVVKRDDGSDYPPLIGGQWRKTTNPAFSYMVLARFPGQAENQLISRAWVEAAQQRWLVWQQAHGEQPPPDIRPLHGQDVAELGQDSNVAAFRYGGWVAPFEVWGGVDALVSGDRAARLAQERNALESYVDATGVGAGVWPQMNRYWSRVGWREGAVRRIMVSQSPTIQVEEGTFRLLRDQLWWLCREWLRTDAGAMLPPDEDLADELCAVHYRVRNGKIEVDDKETLRNRLRRSPDRADALCLTFADSVPKYAPPAYP